MDAPEDSLRVEDIRRQESILDRPFVSVLGGVGGLVWATMTGIANTSKAYYQSLKWEQPLKGARELRDQEKAAIITRHLGEDVPGEELNTLEKLAAGIKKSVTRMANVDLNKELEAVDKNFEKVVDAYYEMSKIPTKGWAAPFKATAIKFGRLERHERNTVIFSTVTSVMIPIMGLALLSVGARAKRSAEWQQDVNEHQERNLIALRKQLDAKENSAERGA